MMVAVNKLDVETIVCTAIEQHGNTREALIPVLSEINRFFGYIPSEALTEIRQRMHLPEDGLFVHESQLFSIASFYQMLSTVPQGMHVVRFCESAPCHVVGGRDIFNAVKNHLKLKAGETSPDKKWTLLTTSCLGVCGVGPVLLVDADIYGNVRPENVPDILAKYGYER